jgi:uncharacterized protein YdeI (YjbR/CyaY-like superfamily)
MSPARPRHPMPDDIRNLLTREGVMAAYNARPPYQQNDYIGWITRARRPETRQKRIEQMLEVLKAGNAYMKMPYRAK